MKRNRRVKPRSDSENKSNERSKEKTEAQKSYLIMLAKLIAGDILKEEGYEDLDIR